jgi:transcriptional regulator with XRE-family HTH domain
VTPVERFATNLRVERERRGWSQEALGFACDLHRTEISLLERAGREPRLMTLVKLTRALEVQPAALLEGIT